MKARVFFSLVVVMVVGALSYVNGQTQNDDAVVQKDPNAPIGSERNPLRVSSGVMIGLLDHRELAKYPNNVCGEGGAQVMHATISPEGKVDRLEWISGPQVYREPTMDAVKRWTYRPYLLNGRPVWVDTTITINVDFECKDPGPPGSERNPLEVSSGVLAGNAIRQDKPHYPQYHCGNPYPGSGVSVMRVTINPEGSVDHIEWMRGSPNYRDAVLEAVRHWTYKPYLLNGKAVWVQTFVTIDVQMGCVP